MSVDSSLPRTSSPDTGRRPASAAIRRRAGTNAPRWRTITAWVLFAPSIIWVLCVTVVPIGLAIKTSFYSAQYLQPGSFVGWKNYHDALVGPGAVSSFIETVVFTAISVAVAIAISLVMALAVNNMRRGATFFRVVFMLPWITSPLLAALLWQWVVSPGVGPISALLGDLLNQQQYTPLNSGPSAMATLIVVSVWRIYPFGFILILAGLRSMPRDLIECSQLDGANWWGRFRYVTFPALRNTVLVIAIVFTMHIEISAELPLVLTGGGPAASTEVVGLRVYREAFFLSHTGLASALAVVLLLINAVVGAIYVLVLRTEDI
jgi:multiple sugar transport system permease protein